MFTFSLQNIISFYQTDAIQTNTAKTCIGRSKMKKNDEEVLEQFLENNVKGVENSFDLATPK